MKCGMAVEIQKGKEVVWKNGMRAMEGVCGKCGTKVCRILGKAGGPKAGTALKMPASKPAVQKKAA